MRVDSMGRLSAALALTLVYSCWVALIANQQPYLVLLGFYFLALAAAWLAYQKTRRKKSPLLNCVVGSVAGYASMAATSIAWRCFIHNAGCTSLNAQADLYFFPMVSMGWLYSGVLFLLITGWKRHP